jgi:hypothetical protein
MAYLLPLPGIKLQFLWRKTQLWVSCFKSSHIKNHWLGRAMAQAVACLSPWTPGFDPGSVHMGFLVDKMALGQAFTRVLRVSPANFIPPVLHYTEKRKN